MLPSINLPSGNNLPNTLKFIIRPYKDSKFNFPKAPFILPINHAELTRAMKVDLDKSQEQGTEKNNPKFTGIRPEDLKIDFVFDNTGTIQGNLLDGVPILLQIKYFLATVYLKQSDSHRPSFLKINYGLFSFDCQLESLQINYTLFDQLGFPLRAKLSASFCEFTDPELSERRVNPNSPDVTHLKRFNENDNLPFLSYEIYGDANFYTQVARANGLTSFRNIKPGKDLTFPSISKSTT